jgi:hypothetical protein
MGEFYLDVLNENFFLQAFLNRYKRNAMNEIILPHSFKIYRSKFFYANFFFLQLLWTITTANNIIKIEFKTNTTNCKMFDTECLLPVHVNSVTLFNELRIDSSANFKYFKIIRIQINNHSTENQTWFDANVVIAPIIVGRDSLLIKSDHIEYRHWVVIMSPDRFVDKVYYVYMFVFQILMSVLMGILLTPAIMLKIIKTPLPVFVGITAQYMFMPLVSIFVRLLKSTIFKAENVKPLAKWIFSWIRFLRVQLSRRYEIKQNLKGKSRLCNFI